MEAFTVPVPRELTLEEFHRVYDESAKPYFEFWNGEIVQKAAPTKLHALLQRLLADILEEGGLLAFIELGLRLHPSWEPVPDVAATVEDFDGPYPTEPVAVVAEILSPEDTFVRVEAKCERYAALEIAEILVFDPASRKAWRWDGSACSLLRLAEPVYRFRSVDFTLDLAGLWKRFEAKLGSRAGRSE